MKRKYLSALLMGTLLVASTTTFTSCKDYDDDISNLQSQIDKAGLQSDIDALKTQLQDAASTASAAKTTAESALAKANDAAVKADVDKAIAAVKATADKAATDVAQAISDAANAQAAADKAQGSADDANKAATAAADAAKKAQNTADQAVKDAASAAAAALAAQNAANAAATQAEFEKALERIGNLETSQITADQLDKKLSDLRDELLGADGDKETIGSLSAKVNAYKGAVEELYSAVTSVELVETYSGVNGLTDVWDGSQGSKLNFASPLVVDMIHGLITDDSTFGNETGDDVKPVVEYVKGKDIDVKDDASIVVRVNPVNADLTKGAKIILLNSNGNSLEDIVEVGTPSKFNQLITSRAASSVKTGLWKLPLSVAEGVSEEDFKERVTVKDENGDERAILYAVAINNTVDSKAEAAADRYVASSYDVKPTYNKFVPSNDFTFKVGGKGVDEIHNRWTGSRIVGENSNFSSSKNPELAWKNDAAAEPVLEGEKKNVENATNDARYWKSLLQVEVGKPFSITDVKTSDNKAADYYYVVLDKGNAIESGVSELNAWKSYDIDGLYEVVPASKNMELTIKTEAANHDIIGFRVYAVNKDGKLLDPDGKSFYVVVGENYTSGIVGNLDAQNKITEKKDFSPVEGVNYGPWELVEDNNACPLAEKPVFTAVYYDKDGNETTDMTEATKIAFKVNDPVLIADGATVTLKSTLRKYTDNNYYEVGTVTATYTKVLPKAFPADITFRPAQETGKGTGYFIAYMKPENGYTVATKSANGSVDLHNIFYNLDNNVSFTIADAAKDAEGKLTSVKADKNNNFVVNVAAKDFIDSKDKHAVTVKYNYGEISLVKDKNGNWVKQNHAVDYTKPLSVTFACWHSASSYAWADKKQPSLQWKATANVIKTDIKDITVKNTYNNDFFGGTFNSLLTNNYLEVKAGSAHLTYEGQKDPYFNVTVDATNGKFIFTQTGIQAENAPTIDHLENLEFIVVDAYGHEVPLSFQVTIKRPASK